jgi:hypothetical protein
MYAWKLNKLKPNLAWYCKCFYRKYVCFDRFYFLIWLVTRLFPPVQVQYFRFTKQFKNVYYFVLNILQFRISVLFGGI